MVGCGCYNGGYGKWSSESLPVIGVVEEVVAIVFCVIIYYYFNELSILFKWNGKKYKSFDVWYILKWNCIINKVNFWSVKY